MKKPETKELVFASTKEYLRFGEFCDTCRKYRYVGICHGVPGVGETRSAQEYAKWDMLSPLCAGRAVYIGGAAVPEGPNPYKPFATPVFLRSLRCVPVGLCTIPLRWPPPSRASSER